MFGLVAVLGTSAYESLTSYAGDQTMNRTVQLVHSVAVALGLLFAASLTNADEPKKGADEPKKGADVVKVVSSPPTSLTPTASRPS
jgi:hypothetical protein